MSLTGPNNTGYVITVNGGSSSVKFAVFNTGADLRRVLTGAIDRTGSTDAVLIAKAADGQEIDRRPIAVASLAAEQLADWIVGHVNAPTIAGIGHRIVHGGVTLVEHQRITDDVLATLLAAQPLDIAHLPSEIALIESFARRFAGVPQVACFDTAFHHDLPRVAKLLPIPRKYDDAGVRRLGFHGLSYTYLMGELRRIAGDAAADGRVILAHLGSGASMAAVHHGRPIDTSMGFTPTAGLVMGTRPGDLDPGLLLYLMREGKLTPTEMDAFINKRCGIAGVSETGSDLRDLIARRASDVRAAEAIDLFCYQARKYVGAFAAALGGVDTLVFAGGIGEHSPEVRQAICHDLDFLGVHLDTERNARSADIVSADEGRVVVRVIRTDEEIVIARTVGRILELSKVSP